jgi:complement component 1 Q subcomponent-binding protein
MNKMTFLGLIKSLYLMENGVTRHVVAGDVLDECLHDLLIDLLEERDISNEFVEKLSDFRTAYERNLFSALLEGTKKFVS